MRLMTGFSIVVIGLALAPAAFAGLADDLALCRKSWWGAAKTAACGRVIDAPDADNLAKAEAYNARAGWPSAGEAGKQAFSDLAESIRLAPWNPAAFYVRAALHERDGNDVLALADYTAAIALAPGGDYYAARARVHRKRGDFAKAIADFSEALAFVNLQASPLSERASIHLSQGDVEAAIKDFETMLQKAGDDRFARQQALTGRAKSFLALGDTARAIADATAVLALNPKSGNAALTRAEAYLKTGDNIPAIADATVAIAAKARGESAHLLRAEARLMTGDVEGARRDVAMAELLAPESPAVAKLAKTIADQVLVLGLAPAFGSTEEANTICLNSRKNDETIASCAQVIADRSFPTARKGYPHNILGHFRYQRGLYDLAAKNFTAVFTTGKTTAGDYVMLGLTYSNLKKYPEAIAAYEEGLKFFPADDGLISGLARVQEKIGDCTAALANFAAALRMRPNRNDYQSAARCHESQGSYAAAAATLGEALKLQDDPKGKPFLLETRAEAYMADGKIDLALQDLWSALALEPNRVASHSAVAEALLMAGKTKDAIAILTKAIPLDPKAVNLLALRAKAHLQAGNHEAALADASASVKLRTGLLVRAEVRLAMKDFAGARADVDEALAKNPFSFEGRALKAAIEKGEAAE